MRVDIIHRPKPGMTQLQGSVRLEGGHAVFDDAVAWVGKLTVSEPGNPKRKLTPADGEEYLRALPYEFRSGLVSAVIVEG